MQTWQTTVLVEAVKGYNPIPKSMTTQARSYSEALAYFQTFGKVIATVRVIGS